MPITEIQLSYTEYNPEHGALIFRNLEIILLQINKNIQIIQIFEAFRRHK